MRRTLVVITLMISCLTYSQKQEIVKYSDVAALEKFNAKISTDTLSYQAPKLQNFFIVAEHTISDDKEIVKKYIVRNTDTLRKIQKRYEMYDLMKERKNDYLVIKHIKFKPKDD